MISFPLFFAHGIEEYANNFWTFDPFYFQFGDNAKGIYILGQILLITLALISYRFFLKGKYGFIAAIALGLLLLFELEHSYRAFSLVRYTPGLVTSFFLVILGVLYWKELLKNWRKR